MELFEDIIRQVRQFVDARPQRLCRAGDVQVRWPSGGRRGIVMKEDLGLELGSPDKESVSSLLWTGDLSLIEDGTITLVGPDFSETGERSLPFGKVVLAGVEGFTEDNTHDRYRDLDLLRYDLDLKGFMIRAVSQYQKEWCRISAEAIRSGFSASILASSVMNLFHTKGYVRSIEVIVVTSSPEDVRALRDVVAPAGRIVAAMDKMAAEMTADCEDCEYQDVCADAEQLKAVRRSMQRRNREVGRA